MRRCTSAAIPSPVSVIVTYASGRIGCPNRPPIRRVLPQLLQNSGLDDKPVSPRGGIASAKPTNVGPVALPNDDRGSAEDPAAMEARLAALLQRFWAEPPTMLNRTDHDEREGRKSRRDGLLD